MPAADDKLASLTDTQILREFQVALVAIYPVLQRLDCLILFCVQSNINNPVKAGEGLD
jgi:hypothetical protein